MKVRLMFYFISILIVTTLIISCGESGDTTTKIVTPLEKSTDVPEINFAVEEAAIRALHKSHDDAVNARNPEAN